MLAVAVMLTVLNGSEGIDQIVTTRGAHAWDLEWSDAEDRVHGFMKPLDPIEGKPFEVSLQVGAFQGAALESPVTISMRCPEWSQSVTIGPSKDAKVYYTTFEPKDSGLCHLDVGWMTTRRKVVHAAVEVVPAPLARTPWYVLIAVIVAVAMGLGIRTALRKP